MELLVPNVAIQGKATQSSTYKHLDSIALTAHYAIDGDFSTNLRSGDKFAHTNADFGAWWQVELKHEFEIKNWLLQQEKKVREKNSKNKDA